MSVKSKKGIRSRLYITRDKLGDSLDIIRRSASSVEVAVKNQGIVVGLIVGNYE